MAGEFNFANSFLSLPLQVRAIVFSPPVGRPIKKRSPADHITERASRAASAHSHWKSQYLDFQLSSEQEKATIFKYHTVASQLLRLHYINKERFRDRLYIKLSVSLPGVFETV